MAEYEDGRRHDTGDVVGDMECVGVSYQEVDGRKTNFTYQFRLKSELEAERQAEIERQEAEEAHQKALERAQKEAEEEELAHRNTEVDEQQEK